MKIGYILFSLAFITMAGLTACSEKHVEEAVFTSEATLSVLETAAYQYTKGDFGAPDATVVAQIKVYDQEVYEALLKVRSSVENGTAISTTEQVALTSALTAFQSYLIEKGIIKGENTK
ncbi:hypothetical protein KBX73_14920 [Acetobacter persici]|uniref:hypothetical protein n=1 Tax=Acetobacter persici TaxID=1076596 RepID=UPI0020CC28D2|nr:hypothetical protein [Acetobacter persici]MCP9321036.1 hypothetical protein [Acetobacter persici]